MYTIYYETYYVTKFVFENGNLFITRLISDNSQVNHQFIESD
jgi:hypothetical protein